MRFISIWQQNIKLGMTRYDYPEKLPIPELVLTDDGSSSLRLPGFIDLYHSHHGAIQESSLVYIQYGLGHVPKKEIRILEIGLGTGLNCLLTWLHQKQTAPQKHIYYAALEPFPITYQLSQELNYAFFFPEYDVSSILQKIHCAPWGKSEHIDSAFVFERFKQKIQEFTPLKNSFDLIYYDAFGPPSQPEMWEHDIFVKMHNTLAPEGVLVTYCAKGAVKRALKNVGFRVEGLKGPRGKREVTRAVKI